MSVLSASVSLMRRFTLSLPKPISNHAAKAYEKIGSTFIGLSDQMNFVQSASGIRNDTESFRRDLLCKFNRIQNNMICAHQPNELLILSDTILKLSIPGDIVELGCYKGGSSAKLSWIAATTGRKLYVCDSFEGLPQPNEHDQFHKSLIGRDKHYNQGDYCGQLDEVKDNINRYGSMASCEFIKGFFSNSLKDLKVKPALIFMDVDLIDSARDCLIHLWNKLEKGGKYFTHEATMLNFITELTNHDWWQRNFGHPAPILMGVGFGMSDQAKNLAFFQK